MTKALFIVKQFRFHIEIVGIKMFQLAKMLQMVDAGFVVLEL